MAAALPFFLIYFQHNRPHRKFLPDFAKAFALGATLFLLPFVLLSSDGLAMIQSNPEVTKIYRSAVPIGENITVYLVPLVHLLILYAAWRVRRLNFDLLCAILHRFPLDRAHDARRAWLVRLGSAAVGHLPGS